MKPKGMDFCKLQPGEGVYTWKLGVGFKHLFIFTGYLPEEMIHHFDYIMFFKTGLKPSTKIV